MVNAVSLFRSAPVQGVKRSLVKRVSFVPEMAIISVKVYNKGPRNVNLSQKRDSLLKDLDKDYKSGKISEDKYEKQKKIIKEDYDSAKKLPEDYSSRDIKREINKKEKSNPAFRGNEEEIESVDNVENIDSDITDSYGDFDIDTIDVSLSHDLQEIIDSPSIDLIEDDGLGDMLGELTDTIEGGGDIVDFFEGIFENIL